MFGCSKSRLILVLLGCAIVLVVSLELIMEFELLETSKTTKCLRARLKGTLFGTGRVMPDDPRVVNSSRLLCEQTTHTVIFTTSPKRTPIHSPLPDCAHVHEFRIDKHKNKGAYSVKTNLDLEL